MQNKSENFIYYTVNSPKIDYSVLCDDRNQDFANIIHKK